MELEGGSLYTGSETYKYVSSAPAATEYDALLGVKRKIPYPKSVFFIVVTEFCERFSFYGMRAVLTLYLRNALLYSDETSTILYHVFVMTAFLTPLFGAILADSFIGKFKTIFYLSIVYAIGNITLSLGASPGLGLPIIPISFLGLGLIALGTGGIKPCVSAFGGDQFQIPGQDAQLHQFFYIFYFAINSGSLISTFVTPMLRKDISCFGQDTCYTLAFGVPAGLMIIALVVFLIGRPFYKVKAPKGNVIVQVVGCISYAICHPKEKRTRFHWLDYANDKYDKEFIEDLKQLLKILVLFIPLPIFWSLFDQQGSTWTLQATRMDGYLFDGWTLKPDQMQVANSFMVLFLIPVFQSGIYPLLGKCNLLTKPLQRMTLGGVLAALSFVVAGVLELHLEPTYAIIPKAFESNVNFVNTVPCPLNVSLSPRNGPLENSTSGPNSFGLSPHSHALLPLDNFVFEKVPALNYLVGIDPRAECSADGHPISPKTFNLELKSETAYSILIALNKDGELSLLYSETGDDLDKSREGKAKLRIMWTGLKESSDVLILNSIDESRTYNFTLSNSEFATDPTDVRPLKYNVYLWNGSEPYVSSEYLGEVFLETGGSYLIVLLPNMADRNETLGLYELTRPNYVSMLLLLPQYVIITVAELLFSVTGYTFSYTQAPNSMKSVIQSMWLLTNAIGNVIVIIVTELEVIKRQALQFFIFSGLMLVATLVFGILAFKYTSVSPQHTTPLFKRKSELPAMEDFMVKETHSDSE